MNQTPDHLPAPDWVAVRADFPILDQRVHGHPLVYFDNANTSQKPRVVIEAVDRFHRQHNANGARAVHQLGDAAPALSSASRATISRFLNPPSRDAALLTAAPRLPPPACQSPSPRPHPGLALNLLHVTPRDAPARLLRHHQMPIGPRRDLRKVSDHQHLPPIRDLRERIADLRGDFATNPLVDQGIDLVACPVDTPTVVVQTADAPAA